jgi:hypothetical protein
MVLGYSMVKTPNSTCSNQEPMETEGEEAHLAQQQARNLLLCRASALETIMIELASIWKRLKYLSTLWARKNALLH